MNEAIAPPVGQDDNTAVLAKQNEYLARLMEQNMLIIDLLERESASQREVTIANFNMPFWALAGFLVKVSLASIPALFVLAVMGFVIFLMISLVVTVLGFALF